MGSGNEKILLFTAWLNAVIGYVLSQPVLSKLAYVCSIAGSIVYIYTTLKKHKNEKDFK